SRFACSCSSAVTSPPWLTVKGIPRPTPQKGTIISRPHKSLVHTDGPANTEQGIPGQVRGNVSLNAQRQWLGLRKGYEAALGPSTAQDVEECSPCLPLPFFPVRSRLCNRRGSRGLGRERRRHW